MNGTTINRDTRISLVMVIALLTAVWQLAEWKSDVNERIERLKARVERLERTSTLAVP